MKTIFRTKLTENYTILPNDTLRDASLSYKARGLLAMILTNRGDWVVTKTWLQDRGTEGREAIKSALDELRAKGYAKFEKAREEESGKWTSNCWTFYDLPNVSPEDGKPADGKPSYGNPDAGKPEDGFPATNKDYVQKDDSQKYNGELLEAIYKAYPRKVGKPKALEAIRRAIKRGADPEDVLLATRKFGAVWDGESDKTFCPHPATWFNQERFNDDPSEWNKPSRNDSPVPARTVTEAERQERIAEYGSDF